MIAARPSHDCPPVAARSSPSPIKVNAANPGYTATDFNGNSGFRSAAEGAEPSVYLATLPDDGPSGIPWGYIWTADGTGGYGTLAW
jgi:hypothetical protein